MTMFCLMVLTLNTLLIVLSIYIGNIINIFTFIINELTLILVFMRIQKESGNKPIMLFDGRKTMEFDNGYSLSIINGFGSDSDNKFRSDLIEQKIIRSRFCEVAVIKNGKFVTKKVLDTTDDVLGWVDKKQLAKIIIKVRSL